MVKSDFPSDRYIERYVSKHFLESPFGYETPACVHFGSNQEQLFMFSQGEAMRVAPQRSKAGWLDQRQTNSKHTIVCESLVAGQDQRRFEAKRSENFYFNLVAFLLLWPEEAYFATRSTPHPWSKLACTLINTSFLLSVLIIFRNDDNTFKKRLLLLQTMTTNEC